MMNNFEEITRICKKHGWTYDEYVERMILVREAEARLMRPLADSDPAPPPAQLRFEEEE